MSCIARTGEVARKNCLGERELSRRLVVVVVGCVGGVGAYFEILTSLSISMELSLPRAPAIRHFHIPHNTPCLPPKICITFVFHFPWVLQSSQEKLKTMLMQNFGGQTRCIMGDVEMANTIYTTSYLAGSFDVFILHHI